MQDQQILRTDQLIGQGRSRRPNRSVWNSDFADFCRISKRSQKFAQLWRIQRRWCQLWLFFGEFVKNSSSFRPPLLWTERIARMLTGRSQLLPQIVPACHLRSGKCDHLPQRCVFGWKRKNQWTFKTRGYQKETLFWKTVQRFEPFWTLLEVGELVLGAHPGGWIVAKIPPPDLLYPQNILHALRSRKRICLLHNVACKIAPENESWRACCGPPFQELRKTFTQNCWLRAWVCEVCALD